MSCSEDYFPFSVTKWPAGEIRKEGSMLNILKKRTKNNGQELRDLLSGYQLPSFSSAVINVLGMLRDPESAMNDIAKQLEIDPGMHVKVLKTVNSAAFGLTTKVANIIRR